MKKMMRIRDRPERMPSEGVNGMVAGTFGALAQRAAVEAAHRRFGKLAFGALFQPAVYFAQKGFIVDDPLARRIRSRRQELARFPETKKNLY